MGGGEVGVGGDGFAELGGGGGEVAGLLESEAEVLMEAGVGGAALEALAKLGGSAVRLVVLKMNAGERLESGGVTGVEAEERGELGVGLAPLAHVDEDGGEQEARGEERRVRGGSGAEKRKGVGRAAEGVIGGGESVGGFGPAGPQAEGGGEFIGGGGKIAGKLQSEAEVVVSAGVGGFEGERLAVGGDGLRPVFFLRGGEGAGAEGIGGFPAPRRCGRQHRESEEKKPAAHYADTTRGTSD